MKRLLIAVCGLFFLDASDVAFAKTPKSLCIAHRGNNVQFQENSFEAIRSAYELGSDGVEFDIHHTLDNVAILSHDENLKRVARSKNGAKCPLNRLIKELTFQEIRDNCRLDEGGEIPSLNEILSFLEDKEIMVFIEVKDIASSKTVKSIERFFKNSQERLKIISFKKKALDHLYKLRAKGHFWKNVKFLHILKYLPENLNTRYGVNLRHHLLNATFLPKFFGKEIGVWTLNSVKILRKAFRKKVNFITTNDPRLCLKIKRNL
jgi:glycerophosphoryl diester phosphodiesterase